MLPKPAARGRVRDLLQQRCFPADVLNERNAKRPKCSTSGALLIRILPHTLQKRRSLPLCTILWFRSQATKRTRCRTMNSERPFFSSAKGVTLRESPSSLAKITKTCSSQTISAAGDLSAAAQHLPDVQRRRCRSTLEAGFLSLIPSPFQTDAERWEKRWLCTRHSSFHGEKRVASKALLLVKAPWRFFVCRYSKIEVTGNVEFEQKLCSPVCTEMNCSDRVWAAPTVSDSPPPPSYTVLYCALSLCDDRMLACWKLNEPRMRWNTAGIDRENVLACAHGERERAAADFETKLETSRLVGGFIGNGEPPPPPPPPCVRACIWLCGVILGSLNCAHSDICLCGVILGSLNCVHSDIWLCGVMLGSLNRVHAFW